MTILTSKMIDAALYKHRVWQEQQATLKACECMAEMCAMMVARQSEAFWKYAFQYKKKPKVKP